MTKKHWNYFISIESDVLRLSNYIEFDNPNMNTYSIELAKILMAATQEVDVLLKQICLQENNISENENGYRNFIPSRFPKLMDLKVEIPKYELGFTPFEEWKSDITPKWWTANNKVKHQRHIHFNEANLENTLNAVAAMYLTNIYFLRNDLTEEIQPVPQLFSCDEIIDGVSPSEFGMVVNYKLP
jgi:hypothetical protein